MTGGRLKRVLPYVRDEEVFATDLRRRRRKYRLDGRAGLSQFARKAGDGGRGAAGEAVRRDLDRRRSRERVFRKSRQMTAAGSMAVSFCCLRASTSLSRVTRRSGKRSRWKHSLGRINCEHTFITASGTRWIPCATAPFLSSQWTSGKAEWRVW